MFPKTEKELEVYFKLLELIEAKKLAELPYTMSTPSNVEYRKQKYVELKEEYLKLVNE